MIMIMIRFQKLKNSLSIIRRINYNTKQDKKLVYTNFMIDGTDIKWEDTIDFTIPINGGRVIKVYGANTIIIASKLPYNESPLYRLSVRFNGIYTPEMKGKYVTDEEKSASKAARDFVSNLVLNKYVKLKNISNEKYDCVLADVYIGDIYLNDLLVKEQYAVKYYDGIKIKPTSWLMYKLIGEI
jgi:endonuclease YncB( thermonuclease family)